MRTKKGRKEKKKKKKGKNCKWMGCEREMERLLNERKRDMRNEMGTCSGFSHVL